MRLDLGNSRRGNSPRFISSMLYRLTAANSLRLSRTEYDSPASARAER
jgi:hypothetical protein